MVSVRLLIILLFVAFKLNAQNINKEQATIHQTIESMFATLTNADTAALKTFVTSNVRFYEYGQVWNMDTLIQKVMQSKSIPDFRRTNSFQFKRTTIHKKTAWTTYYLQSTFIRNGKEEIIKWMETVVLLKDKKQWRIDVLHSTRLITN